MDEPQENRTRELDQEEQIKRNRSRETDKEMDQEEHVLEAITVEKFEM